MNCAQLLRESQSVISVMQTMRPKPAPIVGKPMQLGKPAFGKPDPKLGKFACSAIVDATPGTFVPFNPLTDRRMRSGLRSLGIPA